MKTCLHNVQKRLETVSVMAVTRITMWCLNCGALKLGSDDWQLPLMRPPETVSTDTQKPESD